MLDRLMLALGLRSLPSADPDKAHVQQRLKASAQRLEPVLTAIQARQAQRIVREAGQK